MDRWNNELDALFAGYKAAIPDPEASTNFMPELWRKIEARQSFIIRVKKLTQVFVGAAAAICLLLAAIQVTPGRHRAGSRGTYIDMLTEAHPSDNLASLGIHIDAEA